jgi:hypothetical protein
VSCREGANGIPLISQEDSSIHVKDVLEAIFKSAFVSSEFPVLVMIDVAHCRYEQRKVINTLLNDILGDFLALDCSLSPMELKGKFIVQFNYGLAL